MEFKDHFSRQAEIYLKARPTYPDELFDYLKVIAPANDLCWDCATGNGQAAVSLAAYFKQVIATDGSQKQIDNAIAAPNVTYRVAVAEQSGLPDACADLITVATAAHWFNHPLFYNEAQRVAKPNGILALWAYGEATIKPAIDELMDWFMYDHLYTYWPEERWYVRSKYETLPFPFEAIDTPVFYCHRHWNREQWLNYVKSWSAYNNYVARHNADPIDALLPRLELLWNERETHDITWQLHMKCARLNKP